MYFVVCYDITDNRRRTRLHELLLGYGTPVQRSVFECELASPQFGTLRTGAKRCASQRGDTIRYYQMCGRCCERTESYGTPLVEADSEEDFVV